MQISPNTNEVENHRPIHSVSEARKPKHFLVIRSFLVLIFFSSLAAVITFILYSYTQDLLKSRLQQRLIAIASTAAIQFDPKEIESIRGREDSDPLALKHAVEQLKKIKDANQNIRYAYIMRRTEDPNIFKFIADAESLASVEELDTNKNGIIESEESTPLPGDPFDVSEYPVLRDEAFKHPAVDRELEKDQWSVQLSAYAPIVNENGDAIAIIGIDVIVEDFLQITRATLLPFLLFVLFLILSLTLLTLLLMRFWRERAEAIQELDRQKDELISIVSHQLAAPVTAMKWYLELLSEQKSHSLKSSIKESIKTMQTVTNGLVDLVSMILDVSRLQLGKLKINPQKTDLKGFFAEIFDVIEPKAKEKKIEFAKQLKISFPDAFIDKRLTRMTIENLLTNAVKYTPEGGKIMLRVLASSDSLCCEILDTGCGIPKEEQAKIFDKLFRASNVRDKVEGNGFGLYVAKGAIEAQGGQISFESQEGKGTTFKITVPLNVKRIDL